MLNHGKTNEGTKINVSGTSNYIYIHPDTILTGTITVRNKKGFILWQKPNCTSDDIAFAIEIAKRDIDTGIVENH